MAIVHLREIIIAKVTRRKKNSKSSASICVVLFYSEK